MSMKKENYIFTAFGFDVLIHNVEMKRVEGDEYPEINMNELKLLTAKELLKSRERLTGKKMKFLRTLIKISYQKLSEIIDVPASTLRLWEEKGSEPTGLNAAQERQMRVFVIEALFDLEKKHIEKQIIMSESFIAPETEILDLGSEQDYSYLLQEA